MILRPYLLLAGLSLAACGTSASAPSALVDAPPDGRADADPSAPRAEASAHAQAEPPKTCGPEPSAACAGAAKHLASSADFAAEVNGLAWQPVSLSRTGVLSLSEDLVVDVDLEVDASVLVAPSGCESTLPTTIPRCHAPLFREYPFPVWDEVGRVPGVSCKVVGDHPVRKGETCARIAIAQGTTFRIRAVVEDMHPTGPTFWPFVEFERACAVACRDGEVRCAATQTCFTEGYAACAYCEGQSANVCACQGSCGPKDDASSCGFATSPDVDVSGTCSAGTCVPTVHAAGGSPTEH